jgi:sialidase-1
MQKGRELLSRRGALRFFGLGVLGNAFANTWRAKIPTLFSCVDADAAVTKLSTQAFFHESVVWQRDESGLAPHHVYGLAVTKKGTVLAFSEGRIRPGDEDPHHIVLKRSTDAGASWSENIFIERSDGSYWQDHGQPGKLECWTNTAPVVDMHTGRVFFFYALNEGTKDQHWTRVFYRYSDDDGKTWLPSLEHGRRIEITQLLDPNAFGWTFHMPGPGHGIQLVRQSQAQGAHNGRLLLQVWNRKAVTAPDRHYGVAVIFSDDHGKT